MKHFLVATGPSPAATNAADYAAQLAADTGAKLTPISVCKPSQILAAARDIGADLIVTGITDAGCKDGTPSGRTAAALAGRSTVPVLIVPAHRHYSPLSAIAVGKDVLQHETPPLLREWLSVFSSGLYLLQLTAHGPEQTVEISRSDAIHSTGELFHRWYSIPVNRQLGHSIENYIESNPIDLLVARPEPGLAPELWMLKDPNKDLLFDIHVPLLVLPPHP